MKKHIKTIGIAAISLVVGVGIGVGSMVTVGRAGSFNINVGNNESITSSEIGKLAELNKYINEKFLRDVKEEDIIEGMYKGMFASLDDPYSAYMDKKEFNEFKEMSTGKFVGVGVVVTPNEDNQIQVVSVIKDGPADSVGIKPGDIIWKVDGKEYTAKEMDKAVSVMKGEKGKPVKITFIRNSSDDETEQFEKEIIRDEVINPSVEHRTLSNKIGYLGIYQFEDETYKEFTSAMGELQKENIEGLIIDLRGNGGGDLHVATDIIDELIPEGTIVYTEDKAGKKEYIKSDKKHIDIPLVILVNENTASASEIMTAAVQDSDMGTIIGTKTFGKGVVQEVTPLADGTAVKMTVSEYFSPKGRSIDKKGIEPDIKVELPEEVDRIGADYLDQDVQLKKSIEVIKDKMAK